MFAVGVYSLSSGCFVLGSLSSPGNLLGSVAEIALLVCCLLGLLLLVSSSLGLVASWLPSVVVVFGYRLLLGCWSASRSCWLLLLGSVAWLPSCRGLMLL